MQEKCNNLTYLAINLSQSVIRTKRPEYGHILLLSLL